jgi:uncharacterized membrane protein YbhN (UPF0104 family)
LTFVARFQRWKNSSFARTLLALRNNSLVRLAVNLLVFGFCIYYLAVHTEGMAAQIQQMDFSLGWLAAACAITFVTVWTGAFTWWLLLQGFLPANVPAVEGLRSHLKSSVAKYIPGFAWSYIGKAYLTQKMGTGSKVISILLMWELVQLILTGLGIGLLLFPAFVMDQWNVPDWLGGAFRLTGFLLLVLPVAAPLAAERMVGRWLDRQPLRIRYLMAAPLVTIVGWLLLGLALWTTLEAFGYSFPEAYLFYVFTFAISLVLGILVIPVPNGLGIREGMMVTLLSFFIPTPAALLVSAAARLEIVLGDLLSALLVDGMYHFGRFMKEKKLPN